MGWGSDGYAVRKCPKCGGRLIRMAGNWSGECGADKYEFDCQGKCKTRWETAHDGYRCSGELTRRHHQ